MLRSPNQTANQIRRSYKNDQSNIFVTVYFVTWKYNPFLSFNISETKHVNKNLPPDIAVTSKVVIDQPK